MANLPLGRAILEVVASTQRLESDLKAGIGKIEGFARSANNVLGAIGVGLSVGAFTSWIKASIDAADALKDLQARTGLTGNSLLELQGAALRSGASIEDLDGLFSKLPKRLTEAARGAGDAAEAINRLGLDPAAGLQDTMGFLRKLGEETAKYSNDANKAAYYTAILGKGGDKLIPMVEAIGEVQDRMRRLGITIDQDVIDASDEFNDRLVDMKQLADQAGRQIAQGMLPAMNDLADALIDVSNSGGRWQTVGESIGEGLRVLAAMSISAGAGFTALARNIGAGAAAVAAVGRGEFEIAGRILGERANDWRREADDLERRQNILLGLVKRGEDAAGKVGGGTGSEPKPKPRGSLGALPESGADTKRYEAMVTEAQRMLKAADGLESSRNQMLEAYRKADLIGERDYWAARQAIADEATAQSIAALDKEIAARRAVLASSSGKERPKAEQELQAAIEQRAEVERKAAHDSVILNLDVIRSDRDRANAMLQLQAQLADFAGKGDVAAAIRFDVANQEAYARALASNDTVMLDLLNRLRTRTVDEAKLTRVQEARALVEQKLATEEERIQNSLRTGAIGEFEAMQKTGAARRAAVGELDEIVNKWDEIARATGDPRLIANVEKFRTELEGLRQSADVIGQKFDQIAKDNIATFFDDIVSGTKSVEDAFKSMVKGILKEISQLINKDIANSIMGSIKGTGGSSGGGGMGGLGGMFSSLLGGGLQSMLAGPMASLGASQYATFAGMPVADALMAGIMPLAEGGTFTAGSPLLVGEQGPELMVPKFSGSVIPNHELGRGQQQSVSVNIYAKDARSVVEAESQVAASVARASRRGNRNL